MIKIKVYCDNANFPSWLKKLRQRKLVEIFYCPYETRTRKLTQGRPSVVKYDGHFCYDDPYLKYDSPVSNKYSEIKKIVGSQNEMDVINLDAAYINKCDAFITSDKKHLIGQENEIRDKIETLLELKIYYQDERGRFLYEMVKRGLREFLLRIRNCFSKGSKAIKR